MNNPMMGGPGMFVMMLWMSIGILLFIALVAVVIWLLVRWLNKQQTPTMPYTPQRQDAYQPYRQGYQPPQPPPETPRESGQQYQSPQPQYEQPQVQYPQEQETPWYR